MTRNKKKGKRGFYKPRSIRISDEVWKNLESEWLKSDMIWSKFISQLLESYAKK